MKPTLLIVAFLLAPLAAADTYVHMGLQPEFQYRDDQDVKVRLQAIYVKNDVPTDHALTVNVKLNGETYKLANAEKFSNGVNARDIHHLNFGQLDAGFYEAQITVQSNGETRTRSVDLSVTKPPISYTGTLQGKGRDAVFLFHTSSDDTFTIRTYYNGPLGKTILEETRTNKSMEIEVAGIKDTVTLVEVEGPNGWLNHANKQRNPLTGETTTTPWTWFPDVENTEQFQRLRLNNAIVLGGVIAAIGITGITLHFKEKREAKRE